MKNGLVNKVHHEVVDGVDVELTPIEWCPIPCSANHRFLLLKATPNGQKTEWWIVGTFKKRPLCRFTDEDDASGIWNMLEIGVEHIIKVSEKLGQDFDDEKIQAEIRKLRDEGKSLDEIRTELNERMNEFIKPKPSEKKGW